MTRRDFIVSSAAEPAEGDEKGVGGADGGDHGGLGGFVARDDEGVGSGGEQDEVAAIAGDLRGGGEALGLRRRHDFVVEPVDKQCGWLAGADVEPGRCLPVNRAVDFFYRLIRGRRSRSESSPPR